MPNPNMRRSLKAGKGGARIGAGRPGKAREEAIRKLALALLNRPQHQATLQAKMDDMTIHPSIYNAYLYYAHGKPRESVEIKQVVPVRIMHVYADENREKCLDEQVEKDPSSACESVSARLPNKQS